MFKHTTPCMVHIENYAEYNKISQKKKELLHQTYSYTKYNIVAYTVRTYISELYIHDMKIMIMMISFSIC